MKIETAIIILCAIFLGYLGISLSSYWLILVAVMFGWAITGRIFNGQ